ncbi:MAG TPA: homoserine kinase [Micromonosporaceae bacterium]|nr:homoserine kinase [Micromonosporaceae bacterium]
MIRFTAGSVRVRVPATSANLGPGFDALGLALGIYDVVTARVVPSGIRVRVSGEGFGELPTDATHLVASSALAAFDVLGGRPDGLDITCANEIPQARGLGSSSAAIVAGILLARGLVFSADAAGAAGPAGPAGSAALDDAAVLRLATDIEGHPDNVAPCIYGGFTIAWRETGGARAVRLEPHPTIRPLLFVPAERGLTAEARAALPVDVPHSDAAHSVGRAALLVHAMTADPSLLYEATEDRIHQTYRAPAMPPTADLVARLRGAGVAAVVSGAGPSVLAVTTESGPGVGIDGIGDTPGWRRLSPPCDVTGAVCEVDSILR